MNRIPIELEHQSGATAKFKEKSIYFEVYVVDDAYLLLLGRSWIVELDIYETPKQDSGIHQVAETSFNEKELLSHYAAVFEVEIGAVKNYLAFLQLKVTQTRFFNAPVQFLWQLRRMLKTKYSV